MELYFGEKIEELTQQTKIIRKFPYCQRFDTDKKPEGFTNANGNTVFPFSTYSQRAGNQMGTTDVVLPPFDTSKLSTPILVFDVTPSTQVTMRINQTTTSDSSFKLEEIQMQQNVKQQVR